MTIFLEETTKCMATFNLSPTEKQQVQNLAREIRKAGYAELDQFRIREDFYGLYGDIVQELTKRDSSKIELFYEFAELSNDILNLITPEMAYGYGALAKQNNLEPTTAFTGFASKANEVLQWNDATKQRDLIFCNLCEVLGNTSSLLAEFAKLNVKVHIEHDNFNQFFNLGYSNHAQ